MNSPTRKDYMSDQTIRWCPGCGDYSILAQFQTALAELALPTEKVAVISGIGCSSRFPYYLSTYGFHTIHGRAPAVATGLKIANPELSVWVITGDGDALSIGGNHLVHLLRRNVDLNVMLFNNRIYGLTKGQYSPTSEVGKTTKSSPMGSLDEPFNPAALALGAGATHIARSVDVFPKHLRATLKHAESHRGTSFLEIFQNCNIFNDGAFSDFTARGVRDDRVLYLEAGQPMVWGSTTRRGLVARGFGLEVVELDEHTTEAECVVHDPTDRDLAWLLANLSGEHAPVPVGTLYQVEQETYERRVHAQIEQATARLGPGEMAALLAKGETWTRS